MAQSAHNGNPIPPELANSYGLEVGASEYQRSPAPQVRPEHGASAPQVLDRTQAKPIEYVPYPHEAPEVVPEKSEADTSKRKATILGLSKPIFWVIVGLVVLAVFGVALGAGLGVGLSNSHRSQDSSFPSTTAATDIATATFGSGPEVTTFTSQSDPNPPETSEPTGTQTSITTVTSTAPVTKGTTGLAANSCTFSTPKTFHIESVDFTGYCFTDWPNNDEAFDGLGNITDLARRTVYTFEACMEACLDYNVSLDDDDTPCKAVTYNSNLTSIIAIGQQGGNCFLKDKKGVNQQGSAESACAALVS